MSEGMDEWMNEWMNEYTNERMNEQTNQSENKRNNKQTIKITDYYSEPFANTHLYFFGRKPEEWREQNVQQRVSGAQEQLQ